jgi:hypothetical protein
MFRPSKKDPSRDTVPLSKEVKLRKQLAKYQLEFMGLFTDSISAESDRTPATSAKSSNLLYWGMGRLKGIVHSSI